MLGRIRSGAAIGALAILVGCTHLPATTGPDIAELASVELAEGAGLAHPEIWPDHGYPVPPQPEDEALIADLVSRMTLEEKVGQLVQADLCCVTPEEVRSYNLGSVLNGGNSGPYGDDLAPAEKWLQLADEFWAASTDKSDGGVGIPLVWGTDAVHGHSNIVGATLFPHNIGLGAIRDPQLIERIGEITAREIRVTGQEWTFAPTVAVPQDFRWGRAYEGYSSDPALVASYVGAMVRGLQGPPDGEDILDGPYVIASTKHFLADGGTDGGVDQGNATISEEALRDIHGAPYGPALDAGVATVMASFSGWQGVKMTGNRSLLTDVLKDRMGFGGFVVSDWNAHGQIAGCTNEACPQALLAGIDMYMAPDTWREVYADLLARGRAGKVPLARIDEAVTRILRVKARLGLFEAPTPSERLLSGRFELLGAPEHRAVAREAVSRSLVLLKNQGALPIDPGSRLLVAGDAADDIARQSGGWTLTWQGTGVENDDFPGAHSIWDGLRSAMEEGGGTAELSPDGAFTERPDAAVVVFGETPYAEFQGDRATLALDAELTGPYETMRTLREQGIPVVAVMITGRPLYVNPALNLADAFVVAWLPGSEGGGVSDVLVGQPDGTPARDFSGKLPADWPRTPDIADGALYRFGDGLTYASAPGRWQALPEVAGATDAGDARTWLRAGAPAAGASLYVGGAGPVDSVRVATVPATVLGGRGEITAVDTDVQEGARRFVFTGAGEAIVRLVTNEPLDIARETNGDVLLLVEMRMSDAPASAAIGASCEEEACSSAIPVTIPEGEEFVRYGLPLKCLRDAGVDMQAVIAPFELRVDGPADFALADVRLGTDATIVLPCD